MRAKYQKTIMTKSQHSLTILIIFFLLLCSISTVNAETSSTLSEANHQNFTREINSLIKNGGYITYKNGQEINQLNKDTLFKPASVWKITTAAAALQILGPTYRFKTNFYLHNNILYIKGYGDPFLISEEIKIIAENLKKNGLNSITKIIIDNRSFLNPGVTAGSSGSINPYDAVNTALAVNFNSINIIKSKNGTINSAEITTPNLPIMQDLGTSLSSGKHRIALYQQDTAPLLYAGQLLFSIINKQTAAPFPQISGGSVPTNLIPFYHHRSSKTLLEMLSQLFLYSNNFIANQIYLTTGAHSYGYPATWRKAQEAMNSFLTNHLKINANTFYNQEGSGLSRKNLVTPQSMVTILEHFKPYAGLLPKSDGIMVKSGTLKGVYAYAGYFGSKKKPDPFVLLLNQPKNNRDNLLQLLHKFYLSHK